MAKIKSIYVCQSCGTQSPKWLGRCTGCSEWNTFIEETPLTDATSVSNPQLAVLDQLGLQVPSVSAGRSWVGLDPSPEEIAQGNARTRRVSTGIGELDRVLGGGLVPDSFVLIGGDPGIGKSTLLLQMCKGMREKHPERSILYVSGEESIEQIRSRARRLGVEGQGKVFLASETQLERVLSTIKELRPSTVIMDSLQTFSTGASESAPGSVSQVREVASRLMALAKSAGVAVFLVGHVTKDGAIAGPKVVEHMVDTVLYFEGEGMQSYRLLRTVKNRFGSTHELGVFEMDGEGLREVPNPSSLFLSDREEPVAGTAVSAPLEGSRPLLVELQALVTPCAFGTPRRTAVGLEGVRLALLGAILEKHLGLPLGQQDLFFNVAGGLRMNDPACDLAAAAAIWSSHADIALPKAWVWLGELALTGEVRRAPQMEVRIEECLRLGFERVVVPRSTPKALLDKYKRQISPLSRVEEIPRLIGALSGRS